MTDEEIRVLVDEFRQRADADPEIRTVMEKIRNQEADLDDTSRLCLRRSELMGAFLQEKLPELSPGDRERLCAALLRNGYEVTNEVVPDALRAQDERLGLHLNPVKAAYPAERAQKVSHSLEDPGITEEQRNRRAGAPVANTSMSFHDDSVKENAKIRAKLGLKCYLNRVAAPGCCPWCTGIAGRYVYGEHPSDIFRRHDNCGCTVTLENGRERQDVWSKQTWQADPAEVLKQSQEPVRFSEEQAENLQVKLLSWLTSNDKDGIINIDIDELTPCLRDNSTGKLVQTEVKRITNLSELSKCTEKNGWSFPWNKAPKDSEVYALSVKGSSEIEGLIAIKKEPETSAVYLYWGNAAPHNRITETNAQKKYNGVGGHLFAIAADISVKEGFGGFIYADAANKDLYELFVNDYGATPIPTHSNPYRFFIDGEATKKILETYTFDRR